MHDKPVLDFAFSHDGRALYSCTEDSVLVVDPSTGVYEPAIPRVERLPYSQLSAPEFAGLVRHETSLTSLAVAPDGRMIATTSGWVGTIKLWSTTSGRLMHTLGGAPDQVSWHSDELHNADFDPDGATLAVAHSEELDLCELREKPPRRTAVECGNWIRACSFSPDGRFVAMALGDGAVQIVEAATGTTRAVWAGHRESAIDVAWTRDADGVLSCSLDGYAKLWPFPQPAARRRARAERLWVIARSDAGRVAAAATRPEFGEGAGFLVIIDAETGEERAHLGSPPRSRRRDRPPRPRPHEVRGAAFSPDGRRLAVTGESQVDLWDIENGLHVVTFTGRPYSGSRCEYSPDGTPADHSVKRDRTFAAHAVGCPVRQANRHASRAVEREGTARQAAGGCLFGSCSAQIVHPRWGVDRCRRARPPAWGLGCHDRPRTGGDGVAGRHQVRKMLSDT
jgi:WD40 repeat protein